VWPIFLNAVFNVTWFLVRRFFFWDEPSEKSRIWNGATRGVLSKVPLNAQWAQTSFDWDVLVCVFMDVDVFGLGLAIVFYSIQCPWESGACRRWGLGLCGSGVQGKWPPCVIPCGICRLLWKCGEPFLHYRKYSVMTWAKGSEGRGSSTPHHM